ncbi:hypothetical protein [Paramuribaculum intestinale]|uniref:hypothetical protein n=1 Tax=Paramuribaculum intestinale TaxID=2094151 RepID=UPI00272AD095|nr:hypothetical protein [Paramuribaculum intestinale]
MINKDFLQNVDNFDERPLIHMQQALEERSRERQREILPIIKELNKKHREKDKAKLAAKEAERRKQIETFKALFKEGKSLRECARLMGCSTGLLNKLIEEAKFNKIWFTKKELNEIAELKSSRKNVKPSSTPKQAKKASNKELAEEQKNRIVAITNPAKGIPARFR